MYIYAYTHIYVCTNINTYLYVYIWIYVYMRIFIYLSIYVYTYLRIHTFTHAHTCLYVSVCVCVWLCVSESRYHWSNVMAALLHERRRYIFCIAVCVAVCIHNREKLPVKSCTQEKLYFLSQEPVLQCVLQCVLQYVLQWVLQAAAGSCCRQKKTWQKLHTRGLVFLISWACVAVSVAVWVAVCVAGGRNTKNQKSPDKSCTQEDLSWIFNLMSPSVEWVFLLPATKCECERALWQTHSAPHTVARTESHTATHSATHTTATKCQCEREQKKFVLLVSERVYICMYTYIFIYVCIYIHIYICIRREPFIYVCQRAL